MATKHIQRRIPRRYKSTGKPRVVTTGPYSIIRNPLYIGNIIAMMGFSILSELVWLIPIVFVYLFFLFSLAVRYEEYKLGILFGREYEDYRQQVHRWIPRLHMIPGSKGSISTWSKSLKGELQSTGPAALNDSHTLDERNDGVLM